MTTAQYDRWKDFALRMARTCFRHRRRPDTKWVVAAVEDVFASIPREDIGCLVDWDHSDDYPEGHPCYSRKYRCPCWHCSKVLGWPYGTTHPECRYRCEDGRIYDYAAPYPMCDAMSEWETSYIYEQCWSLWNAKERAKAKALRHRDNCDAYDQMKEDLVELYGGPVRCCIRAGLDMASAPSAGVVGFTVGHVRRMYGGTIPDWIAGEFVKGKAGEEEEGEPIDLNEEPDTAGVWL